MSGYGFPDGQEITQWLGQPIDEQTAFPIGAGSKVVGPAVLANFASIILAVKPTGGPVSVTIKQEINGGPPGLTLSQTVTIPAGSTLFEAFVLFADQVTVTLQGAVGGTTVDYAVYPSNTTTNAQVTQSASISIQHNEVPLASEPTLDFVDVAGFLSWVLTDDAANTRVKIAAALKASVGAAHSSVATACPTGVATQVILDTLDVNTDGYSINHGCIYVPRPGYYDATSLAQWAAAAGGYREIGIWIVNAAGAQLGVVAFDDVPSIGAGALQYVDAHAGAVNLAAGQGIGVWGLQTSGGPLNWQAGSGQFPQLALEFRGA